MWNKLQLKNTIIIQLFYGQFKYILTCEKFDCNKILYEYFLTLSIPVVILYVEFVSANFTKYYFNIPFKEGKIFTLRKIISELLGIYKFSFIIYRKINKECITIENDNSFVFAKESNEFICFQFDNSNNSFKPNDECYIKYINQEYVLSSPLQKDNIDMNEIDTMNNCFNNNLISCKLYCMDTFIDFIVLEIPNLIDKELFKWIGSELGKRFNEFKGKQFELFIMDVENDELIVLSKTFEILSINICDKKNIYLQINFYYSCNLHLTQYLKILFIYLEKIIYLIIYLYSNLLKKKLKLNGIVLNVNVNKL